MKIRLPGAIVKAAGKLSPPTTRRARIAAPASRAVAPTSTAVNPTAIRIRRLLRRIVASLSGSYSDGPVMVR